MIKAANTMLAAATVLGMVALLVAIVFMVESMYTVVSGGDLHAASILQLIGLAWLVFGAAVITTVKRVSNK